MSQFISTTPLLNMRPVGSPAERSLPRLQAILEREFKGGFSFILAEPVGRTDGAGIDWYADIDGPLTPLSSLSRELSDYYKARLQSDVSTIANKASEYEARTDQAARSTAAALRNAVTYPGDENVWLSGDVGAGNAEIILTCWGYEPRTSELTGNHVIYKRDKIFPASAQVLIDQNTATDQRASPAAIAAPRERRFAWRQSLTSVLWALALLFPFATAWLLIPACGVRVPFTGEYVFGWGGGAFCRQLENSQLAQEEGLGRTLAAETAALKDQLTAKIVQCLASTQPQAPVSTANDETRLPPGVDIDPNETSISLTWNNTNDLDLYLVCPDGVRVPLQQVRCGARHKVDMNRTGEESKAVSDPVEYIRWEDGPPEPGTYRVEVEYFSWRQPSEVATDFTVTMRRNGKKTEFHGKTSDRVPPTPRESKEVIPVTEFAVP